MGTLRARRSIVAAVAAIVLVVVAIALVAGYAALRPPPPVVAGLYGPGIAADSLANTQVGGRFANQTAYRFRASTTSVLERIRVYIIGPEEEGYGAGTGGTFEVTVEANGARNMPSGTILATTTYRPRSGAGEVIEWPAGAALVAGSLYHVVFTNVDPDPEQNFASVDGLFLYEPTTPRQPRFPDVDWGQPLRQGEGPWEDRESIAPIMELSYADGTTAGLGYMEIWIRSHRPISGPAMARETITVSDEASRLVTAVSIRLMRLSGPSPLMVALQQDDGSVLGEGAIPSSDIPIGLPGIHREEGHATWATLQLATPQTLEAGRSYDLTLRTTADTVYSIFVIRKGTNYGYGPTTYFAEGSARYTSDGQNWTLFTQDGGPPRDEADLQFYFE